MKKLPDNYYFMLAEDVRPEPNNKMTVLGWHAAPVILIPKGTAKPEGKQYAIESLCIVVVFLDGEGDFTVEPLMVGPGDVSMPGLTKDKATKEPKRALTLAFKFAPFPLPSVGKFTFRVSLDDRSYEYKFEVQHEEKYFHLA